MTGVFGQEILMIGVRILKTGKAFDAGDNGIAPEPGLAKLNQIGLGRLLLLRIEREERAAILGAVVKP